MSIPDDVDHYADPYTAPYAGPAFYPMPPKVAAAVVAVMSRVPKLGKDEKNLHGNYKFAGIDAFLEAVRPLCAEAGLIILQDEESCDFREGRGKDGGVRNWLLLKFRFTLAHSSGETWEHRPLRTIMVDASMGSQSFGAAQSYALKQFQRSLFQIATGENEEADTHEHADLPAGKTVNKSPPAAVRKPLIAAKPLSVKQREWIDAACRDLETMSRDMVLDWEIANQEALDRLGAHNTEAWNRVHGMIVDRTADPETGERGPVNG